MAQAVRVRLLSRSEISRSPERLSSLIYGSTESVDIEDSEH
jgi:hypothetical protein